VPRAYQHCDVEFFRERTLDKAVELTAVQFDLPSHATAVFIVNFGFAVAKLGPDRRLSSVMPKKIVFVVSVDFAKTLCC
jgi:hypothetical protein